MLSNLLPGTDNFFKYLMTVGLVLVGFAIIYPLKQEQQLRLESIALENESIQIQSDVSYLKSEGDRLASAQQSTNKRINELASIKITDSDKQLEIEKAKIDLKNSFDQQKEAFFKSLHEADQKNIKLQGNNNRVKELRSQIWSFFAFRVIFLALGAILGMAGLRFWIASSYAEELVKTGNVLTNYRSSYIRCLDHLKDKKKFGFFILLIVIGIATLSIWLSLYSS